MANWFLCSMGANLQPEFNFAKARSALINLGEAYYSRAIYTKPVAMQSAHDFLNALFILHTELDAASLKQQFNAIEQQLGRDRSDPLSAIKDRPMDIDIIGQLTADHSAAVWQQVPDYLASSSAGLKQLYNQLEAVQ
jgi:2-amino-4-hydroxy-6-hydroxymethyldihydropteridine diphosphokinase